MQMSTEEKREKLRKLGENELLSGRLACVYCGWGYPKFKKLALKYQLPFQQDPTDFRKTKLYTVKDLKKLLNLKTKSHDFSTTSVKTN